MRMDYLADVCEELMDEAMKQRAEQTYEGITEREMYTIAETLADNIRSAALVYLNAIVWDFFHPEDPDS